MPKEGMGRFTEVGLPPAAAALLAVSGFLLGLYAALFATWHRVY